MKRITAKFTALSIVLAHSMFGAATGLPWEQPLALILASIQGPVGYSVGGLILAVCGFQAYRAHDHGEQMSRVTGAVMAITLIVFASPYIARLFGVSGCCV